jgi:AraC-like DNA-binding protein
MPTISGPENSTLKDTIISILASPEIRFTIDNVAVRKFPPSYTFGPHAHRFIEIDFIEDGGCGMLFGTEPVGLTADDCLLIYPEASHFFFTKARSSCTIVQLEFAVENFPALALPRASGAALSFLEELRSPTRPFLKLLPQTSLSACIRNIRHEFGHQAQGWQEMLKLLFAQLLILLSREVEALYSGAGGESDSEELAKGLAAALTNEYEEHILIEDIAAAMGVSSRHLRSRFHRAYGMTASDFLLRLRLRKASTLLAQRNMSILEVALQSGFSSSQYFARVFKRELGLSPGAFRELLARSAIDRLPERPQPITSSSA